MLNSVLNVGNSDKSLNDSQLILDVLALKPNHNSSVVAR